MADNESTYRTLKADGLPDVIHESVVGWAGHHALKINGFSLPAVTNVSITDKAGEIPTVTVTFLAASINRPDPADDGAGLTD